jgi:hypothetical protein
VNCAYNESSVFSQPAVKEKLGQYVLVRLYTDKVRAGFEQTMTPEQVRAFQQEHFQSAQLPLYAVLRPKGDSFEVVGAPYAEGKINSPEAFVQFLRKPLPTQTADARESGKAE